MTLYTITMQKARGEIAMYMMFSVTRGGLLKLTLSIGITSP